MLVYKMIDLRGNMEMMPSTRAYLVANMAPNAVAYNANL